MSNTYPIPTEKTPQNQVYFTAWPIGYPVLITLASFITQGHIFWASKLLNLLLLGLGILLLRHIDKAHAYLLAGAYCTFTMLAAYTYTWSEAPFDFGCLLFVYLLTHLSAGKRINRTVLLLFLTCAFLFLMRYVGFYSFGILALAAAFFWKRGHRSTSFKLFAASFSLCLIAAVYFCINYYITDSFSGGDRLAGSEPLVEFIYKQMQGIINEFFLVRKHYASGPPDTLFWIVLALQTSVVGAVVWLLKDDLQNINFKQKNKLFPRLCFLVAGIYFLLLSFLRANSPFDPLDFRLLSPAVFLTLIALLYYITILPESHKHKATIIAIVMSFFMASLLLNLPKAFLLQQLLY